MTDLQNRPENHSTIMSIVPYANLIQMLNATIMRPIEEIETEFEGDTVFEDPNVSKYKATYSRRTGTSRIIVEFNHMSDDGNDKYPNDFRKPLVKFLKAASVFENRVVGKSFVIVNGWKGETEPGDRNIYYTKVEILIIDLNNYNRLNMQHKASKTRVRVRIETMDETIHRIKRIRQHRLVYD